MEAADKGGALERRRPSGVEAFAFEVMGESVAGHGVIHFGERRVPDFFVRTMMVAIADGARFDG